MRRNKKKSLHKKPALPDKGKQRLQLASMPEVERIVLLNGQLEDTSSLFPQGWASVSHSSGESIYVHRASRVCTLAWPYQLKAHESEVNHTIPVYAHPGYTRGLQYWRDFESSFHFLYDKWRPASPSSPEAYLAEVSAVDELSRSRQDEEDENLSAISSGLSSLNLNTNEEIAVSDGEKRHAVKLRICSNVPMLDQRSNEDLEDFLFPEDILQSKENQYLPSKEEDDHSVYLTDDEEGDKSRLIISVSDPDASTETQKFLLFNLKDEKEAVSVEEIPPEVTVKPKRTKALEECIQSLRQKELWKPLNDEDLEVLIDHGIGNYHELDSSLCDPMPDGRILLLQILSSSGDESSDDIDFTEHIIHLVRDDGEDEDEEEAEEEYYPTEAQVLEDLAELGEEAAGGGEEDEVEEEVEEEEVEEDEEEIVVVDDDDDDDDYDGEMNQICVPGYEQEVNKLTTSFPIMDNLFEPFTMFGNQQPGFSLNSTRVGATNVEDGHRTGPLLQVPWNLLDGWDLEEEIADEINAISDMQLAVDSMLYDLLLLERDLNKGYKDEAAKEQLSSLFSFLVDTFCQTKYDVNRVLYLIETPRPETYDSKLLQVIVIGIRLLFMQNRIRHIMTGFSMLQTHCRRMMMQTNYMTTDLDEEQREDKPALLKIRDCPHLRHTEGCPWSSQGAAAGPIPSTSKADVSRVCQSYEHWEGCEKEDGAGEGSSQGRRLNFSEWIQQLKSKAVPLDLVRKCPFIKQTMTKESQQEGVGRSQGCGRGCMLSPEERLISKIIQNEYDACMEMLHQDSDSEDSEPHRCQLSLCDKRRISHRITKNFRDLANVLPACEQKMRLHVRHHVDAEKIVAEGSERNTRPSREAILERIRPPPEKKTPKKNEKGKGKKIKTVYKKRK